MGYIKKLKNNELVGGTDKHTIYPVTSTKAVFEEVTEGSESSFKSQKTINGEHDGRIKDLENEMPDTVKSITINGGRRVNRVDENGNVDLTIYSDEGQDYEGLTEVVADLRDIVGENPEEPQSGTLLERVDTLEDAVGTGGSVDQRISDAVTIEKNRAEGIEGNLQTQINGKQKTLSVGAGITLTSDGIISATADPSIGKVVEAKPTTDIVDGMIYLVQTETPGTYVQWVHYGNDWTNKGEISLGITTDDTLDSTSSNPIQNAAVAAQIGYFVCGNGYASSEIKDVDALGFNLPDVGGDFKIKMNEANTHAGPVYLRFNLSNATKAELKYNRESVSSTNTWEEGEVISVYYDGNVYQSTNVLGGSSDLKEIKGNNGYIVNLNVGIGNTVEPEAQNAGTVCKEIKVEEGDVFLITAHGGYTTGRAWGFIDSNRILLDVAEPKAILENKVLVVPSGVDKVILNNVLNGELGCLDYKWYYAKAGSTGAHDLLANGYLYTEMRTLDVSQYYRKGDAVKTKDGELRKLTQDIGMLNLTDEVSAGDVLAQGRRTFYALNDVSAYNDENTYSDGDYAIKDGVVKVYDETNTTWTEVTLADYKADTEMWKELTVDELKGFTEQNSIFKDIAWWSEELFNIDSCVTATSNKSNITSSITNKQFVVTSKKANTTSIAAIGTLPNMIIGRKYRIEFDYCHTMGSDKYFYFELGHGYINSNNNFIINAEDSKRNFIFGQSGHVSVDYICEHRPYEINYLLLHPSGTGMANTTFTMYNISIKEFCTAVDAIPQAVKAYDIAKDVPMKNADGIAVRRGYIDVETGIYDGNNTTRAVSMDYLAPNVLVTCKEGYYVRGVYRYTKSGENFVFNDYLNFAATPYSSLKPSNYYFRLLFQKGDGSEDIVSSDVIESIQYGVEQLEGVNLPANVELGAYQIEPPYYQPTKYNYPHRMSTGGLFSNAGSITVVCKDGYEANIAYYTRGVAVRYYGWKKEHIGVTQDYPEFAVFFRRADNGDVSDSDLDCVETFKYDNIIGENLLDKAVAPAVGYKDFTVSVDTGVADTVSETLALQDSQVFENDNGRIYLPATYSQYGKPTRLIIHCHGASQNYNNGNVFPAGSMNITLDYLLAKGYAVMDVNGMPGTHSFFATTSGNPVALRSYIKAYDWAIKNFNLYKEIFVVGISAGSIPALQISNLDIIPVLASATYCGIMDFSRAWMLLGGYHPNNQGPAIKSYLADKYAFVGTRPTFGNIDPCSPEEWKYIVDNVKQFEGWNTFTMGITSTMTREQYREIVSVVYGSTRPDWIPDDYSFDSVQQMLLAFRIPQRGDLSSYQTVIAQEKKLFDTCAIQRQVPIKLFHASNDNIAPYRYSQYYYEMCKRGGSIAEFRTFPSGGHNPTGNTITQDGITTNVLTVELLNWLQRFE